MWGGLGDRLAELGDDLSRRAHTATHHNQPHQDARTLVESARQRLEENKETLDDDDTSGDNNTSQENQTDVVIDGDGNSAAADSTSNEQQQPQLPRWASSFATTVSDKQNQQNMIGSLRNWTQNVVESTKHIVNETRETLEKEQARIQATAPSLFHRGQGGGPYKRDPTLPLDVEALRDAEVVYITDRIVTLSHPYMQSTTDGDITPDRKLAAVGQLLQRRHGGRYMVWNLSEVEYESSVLDDQVLVYKFPGSPSPPLGLLLKLLLSMESWLKADERNVAVLHCLTGRGRTSTVLAAFLCWTGEAGFNDVNGALKYIARCKRVSVDALTIPSQVRYVSYFANMLDGVRPSQPPLLLKRIIMSEAPKFGKRVLESSGEDGGDGVVASGDSSGGGGDALLGCAPYLQIFKAGSLVFTTAASVNYAQTKDDLPFVSVGDGPVSFVTEAVVQGDILLRCRHLTRSGQRVSMFRCAFHTGYVPPKVLRLTKAQLDGACGDKRFSDDFFLDLIFEPCDEATASKHLMSNQEKTTGTNNSGNSGKDDNDETEGGAANEAAQRRSMGSVSNANTVSASAYDSMLHRDSRFWDVIAKRREENMKKLAEIEKRGEEKDDSKNDMPLSGPTIGRRREFPPKQSTSTDAPAESAADSDNKGTNESAKTKPNSMRSSMNAFSIGEEFGLGFESSSKPMPSSSEGSKPPDIPASPPAPKKPDALMEALMGLDEDGLEDDEEVDFIATVPETNVASKESSELSKEAATTEAPSQPTVVETNSIGGDAEADSAISKANDKDIAKPSDDPDNSGITGHLPSQSVQNESILSDFADDLANLDVVDDELDLDGDDFNDFGDFDEDDAELEDLENFLNQVTTK
eukprot:CAMPEP_0201691780 /NCGR_PEP_ID=MMETSP0578-20130828/4846_1 /ASSEMBLY_ACC=CAM_ASM_000663 /TAXON_ID=267565 /ORGANISM="Skeletonema grethea, Strain CCMP 1804" /LENGTH=862 /DNA_ID=CAMNT_0048177041 /DNA_START=45 /DNA_END=2633 /DNA_ORIENTATION=+